MLKKLIITIFTVLILASCVNNSTNKANTIATVTSNTLDNGLFYAISAKQENSDKIQLRLMIKSGSFSETDAQSGYAHIVEHMAFNGTENFPKHKIIELFEKSGLTFGHDINAYTTFDATVYTLSIPKSDTKLLADTLLYLRDVLTAIEFDQSELNKELGVIENEYRYRVPQEEPYEYALFTDYIAGSEYAKHLPIGTLESIDNSTVASIKEFYKAWYRPNNAKLLITGGVDSENTDLLIREIFASIKKSGNNNPQIVPATPPLNTESQAYSSKVINFAQTNLFFETPMLHIQNSKDLSYALKLDMLEDLINYRLNVQNNQRQHPFGKVGSNYYELLSNKSLQNIYICHQQGESQQAIEFVAQELARINQHGFNQVEYEQQIAQFKSSQAELADIYINKDSAELANDIIHAWSTDRIEYSLEIEQQAFKTLLETVSLKELNLLANELINTPSKLTFATPYQSNKPNMAMADKIFSKTINKPIKNTKIKIETLILPVVKTSVTGSKIESETFYPEQQITQWQLSNGVDILLQPDHSVKNSISMSFTAPGGVNSLADEQLIATHYFINSYLGSGLVGLSQEALLQEFIKAKVELTPLIAENNSGFTMYSINKPESLEFLFSMLHSAFTSAKIKEKIFTFEKNRLIEQQKSDLNQPMATTFQKVQNIIYPDNNRQKNYSVAELQTVQKKDVEALHQTLFASANGYKLTIVGDFIVEQLKPVILKYIAVLPSGKQHKFSRTPQSLIKQASQLNETTNPQDNAIVALLAVTDTPNKSIKDIYQADLMQRIISQTLTQIVREKLSLTYSPYVMVTDQQAGLAATVSLIQMITKVEDAKKTQQVVSRIVNDFIENGITPEQLADHKKGLQQSMASALKTSTDRQWLLHRDHLLGFELSSTDDASAIIDSISIEDMNLFIKAYLNPKKTLQMINLPENYNRNITP